MKKVISILLCAAIIIAVVPLNTFAEEINEPYSLIETQPNDTALDYGLFLNNLDKEIKTNNCDTSNIIANQSVDNLLANIWGFTFIGIMFIFQIILIPYTLSKDISGMFRNPVSHN